MKKMLIWLLALLLLAASIGTFCFADTAVSPDAALVEEARSIYRQSLYAAGRESFQGVCGLMTSYQLWKLGVNKDLVVYDGNKQFDAYRGVKVTTGGHNVKAYSAEEMSLQEALLTITQGGTRPARNILVGFQWTSTEAGGRYGHACVINAIQDGVVYFTESFSYAMGKMEGQVLTCSIEEFCVFFEDWTVYEGCIDFGVKQYANSCQSHGTDLYVQLRFDSNLRSQPCLLGQNDCQRLRNLTAGEVLHATGVYTSGDGDLFYQIDDSGVTGYVSANAVHMLQRNDGVSLENPGIPRHQEPGEDPKFTGAVSTEGCRLTAVRLEIADLSGNVILQGQVQENGQLNELNEQLALNVLTAGSYQLTLYADAAYAMAENGVYTVETVSHVLLSQLLDVGVEGEPLEAADSPQEKDGWFQENGTWYCYENGQPCTGWVTRIGVDYLLKEDGSVTTGWSEEDGWIRYFSATGALCSGWVTTPDGTYYFISDGVMATGLTQIDDTEYYFGEDGRLFHGGSVTVADILYKINPDGTAVIAE